MPAKPWPQTTASQSHSWAKSVTSAGGVIQLVSVTLWMCTSLGAELPALSMWPPSSVLAVLSPPAGAQPASPAAPAAMAATAPMPMNERRDMPLVVFSIVPISSLGIGAYRSACTEARRCGRRGARGDSPAFSSLALVRRRGP